MRKITRSLTVIGSAVALTFAGTGVASASSRLPGEIGEISSRFLNPNYDAERELRDAAVSYAARSVGASGSRTLDNVARDRAFPGGGFNHLVSGTDWRRDGGSTHYVYFKVEKNNRGPGVDRLNANWFREGGQGGKDYGVHVTTSGDFHHVTVVFRH